MNKEHMGYNFLKRKPKTTSIRENEEFEAAGQSDGGSAGDKDPVLVDSSTRQGTAEESQDSTAPGRRSNNRKGFRMPEEYQRAFEQNECRVYDVSKNLKTMFEELDQPFIA